jgi:molybdopterin-dependent oxidoreductase alpha subunit
MARRAGGFVRLYRRMRSKNACKTCALGMGGRRGGMVNESGHFPEVCKKSLQAQASDMDGGFSEADLARYPIARLEAMTSAELERLGRITFPMLARHGDARFRRIPWDEAFDLAATALRGAPPGEVFFYSSGRSSNEAAFLLQVVARAYGTNNINNCSYYCHSASGAALSRVYGSGTASVVLEDLRETDLLVIAGANPASNHPRLMTQVMNLRRRGGKVIVVNPLRELGLVRFRIPSDWRSMLFGTTMSDLYLMPHVGTDVALFKAILKGIVEAGGVDEEFVAAHTSGWTDVAADVASARWDDLLGACGVARADVDRAVGMLTRARRGVLCWAMGLTHHANGVDNVLALANIALSRGWLGRRGSGLMPIRGHSNVQGVGSVGVTPKLREAFAKRLYETYGVEPDPNPGWDTYRSMEAAAAGRVRVAVLLGGNLYASNPDLEWASAAMRRIPLTVYLSTKWNQGHVHGRGRESLILPVLARDEEAQATTQESMFNFVRISEGGTPAVAGEMRSEVDIIAALAERILPAGRFDWSDLRSHERLRAGIARVVPGYGAIGEIDRTGAEFQIAGRTFHEPAFATPDARARFHVTVVPAPGEDAPFRLTTLRSEGQFNTVVYEEEDPYRGNTRRDVVMMSDADAGRLEVREGDRVVVETDTGSLVVSVAIVDITPGNVAMYYPEANVLVPRRLDPRSGTPAFKSVAVRIRVPVHEGRVESFVG